MNDKKENQSLMLKNSQLGELVIDNDSIIHFNDGIFGYENLKNFTIVDLKETEPFLWLVAIDEPEIGLPILKYKYIYPDYQLSLTNRDRKDLHMGQSDPFYLFFIITVNEELEQVTANLKGPLVINWKERLGVQIISPNDDYVINYPVIHNNNNK